MSRLGELKFKVTQMKKEAAGKRADAMANYSEEEDIFFDGKVTALHEVLQVIEELILSQKKGRKHGNHSKTS